MQVKPAISAVNTVQATIQPVASIVPTDCYANLMAQYSWDWHIMLAIAHAESSCNPNAISPANYDGIKDYGLLQLHGQEILDPSQNIATAYHKWLTQGYHAWSTYNSGAYLTYMQ